MWPVCRGLTIPAIDNKINVFITYVSFMLYLGRYYLFISLKLSIIIEILSQLFVYIVSSVILVLLIYYSLSLKLNYIQISL